MYRFYNKNINNPFINKLYIKQRIEYLQNLLKIKKIKMKKGRVTFSFHSLYYHNFLILQHFEIELPGVSQENSQRKFLEQELNPQKWYHDYYSTFLLLLVLFCLTYSLETYLMYVIKDLILIDSGIAHYFTIYLNPNTKTFNHLVGFIHLIKLL